MLTAGQLSAMRATAERALPDRCVIERSVSVSDGGGGSTPAWSPLASNVACRIAPLGGGEGGNDGGRVTDETTHVLTLPAQQPISEADRVILASGTYEVTAVRERGSVEITRRVELKEAS